MTRLRLRTVNSPTHFPEAGFWIIVADHKTVVSQWEKG